MPTFLEQTFSSYFKRILQFGHSGNTGTPTSTTRIEAGDGVSTSISLSDDVLSVQPVNDDSVGSLLVKSQGGSNILAVDTTNSNVLAGASQVNTMTLFKEMGLYDFTPAAGYHYPLVANTMHFETAFAADTDWGNGADPPTTLDVSGLTAQENAVAVYWYLENNITLDAVRYITTADGSDTLNFHLFAYTLDTSSNHGDLSSGTLHAHVHSVSATATTVKTGTLTLDTANIDASKVVIGFLESDSTTDVSVALNIKYHIR